MNPADDGWTMILVGVVAFLVVVACVFAGFSTLRKRWKVIIGIVGILVVVLIAGLSLVGCAAQDYQSALTAAQQGVTDARALLDTARPEDRADLANRLNQAQQALDVARSAASSDGSLTLSGAVTSASPIVTQALASLGPWGILAGIAVTTIAHVAAKKVGN